MKIMKPPDYRLWLEGNPKADHNMKQLAKTVTKWLHEEVFAKMKKACIAASL